MTVPTYAAGAGFVVHRSGDRLNADECQRIAAYLRRQLANPGWSIGNEGRQQDLESLEAAMRASFPDQKEDAA
jgi:hypothetical protein